MKRLRIYADTSVYGGCFDEEFSKESNQLFEEIKNGKYLLVVSQTIQLELEEAPSEVKEVLFKVPKTQIEYLPETESVIELRNEYIKAGILGEASLNDATHVAEATIGRVDVIVSWNFKHIVHFEKIRKFNGINLIMGYHEIAIYSPKEVVEP